MVFENEELEMFNLTDEELSLLADELSTTSELEDCGAGCSTAEDFPPFPLLKSGPLRVSLSHATTAKEVAATTARLNALT